MTGRASTATLRSGHRPNKRHSVSFCPDRGGIRFAPNSEPMTEYTAKRARTRGQLLAAGQELLPGAVRRGLEHALGPGPVTLRADVSRQTWYRYWRGGGCASPDE